LVCDNISTVDLSTQDYKSVFNGYDLCHLGYHTWTHAETDIFCPRWRCGAVGRVSGLGSRGRGFESRPGTQRKNSRHVSHTYVPLSPSSISWYRPKGGDALRLGSKAGMVRVWVAGKTV